MIRQSFTYTVLVGVTLTTAVEVTEAVVDSVVVTVVVVRVPRHVQILPMNVLA